MRTPEEAAGAVGTFCSKVRRQLPQIGLFKGHTTEELRELAVRFECCQLWIIADRFFLLHPSAFIVQIANFCKNHRLN